MLRTFIDRELGDIVFTDKNFTFIRHNQPHRHIKRSSLSRTVGTEQSDDLSLSHVDGNMIDHCPLAVLLHQIISTQYQHFFLGHTLPRFGIKLRGLNAGHYVISRFVHLLEIFLQI
ncbi:hypothetical protein SDC9_125967 [bioreactor metagenome]|uniref:Uncharacterized protein n=1 Tax=bioreactor metagenome TaxID=1076179 RepID=A0A645CQF6_9ZZZZ